MPTWDISNEQEFFISLYSAFNRREIESVLGAMHPEVEWPNGMEGGWEHGRDAVRAYWTRQFGLIDPRVEATAIETAGDGRIIVQVHQVVRDLKGAVLLDRMVQHIYQMDGGLIRRMDIRE